jgi:hypothetical protein
VLVLFTVLFACASGFASAYRAKLRSAQLAREAAWVGTRGGCRGEQASIVEAARALVASPGALSASAFLDAASAAEHPPAREPSVGRWSGVRRTPRGPRRGSVQTATLFICNELPATPEAEWLRELLREVLP